MIRLPQLQAVTIRGFTLYRNKPTINATFGSGVFCLAGANGLGKSTFLAALSFGMTGIATDPSRSFRSVDEYYKYSISYSENHFDGRIRESDREGAEIEIQMEINGRTYQLTRNMFEPLELRALEINDLDEQSVVPGIEDLSPGELHEAYARTLVSDCGLSSFEQFVFLQHFVLTFDERRHLLFWDTRVASQALYLAFGLDPSLVREADQLDREIERQGSQARNLQYQATTARQRAEDILNRVEADDDESEPPLVAEYRELIAAVEEFTARIESEREAVDDAQMDLTATIAEQAAARSRYEEAFAARLESGPDPAAHPLVGQALRQSLCGICGSADDGVASSVQAHLDEGRCPLCESGSTNDESVDASSVLEEADQRLSELVAQVDERATRLRRRQSRLEEASQTLDASKRALDAFVAENLEHLPVAGEEEDKEALLRLATQYQTECEDALRRKEGFVRKRDKAKRRLSTIRKRFAKAYADGEAAFVPLFTELAGQFLGLEIDLSLDVRASGAKLVLSLEGSRRRGIDQLSESQRYFVDIALRMALARYMSIPDSPATLFIDTPEGSLDIAYESRAGHMFGQFVATGYHIVMTANINTSRLLLDLASSCGSDRMRLMRMTDWTALSNVQADSEELFDSAFSEIEEALSRGGA